jgi:uncharacterized delta-60 repeat protein
VAVQTRTVNGQPTIRIIVAGYSESATEDEGLVSAYTPGGALDPTFGAGGSFTTQGPANYTLNSLALEADGSIVVSGLEAYFDAAGAVHYQMPVGHLTVDGAADPTFGPDGSGFTAVAAGGDTEGNGVAIDPTDGAIVACGWVQPAQGRPQALIARLTAPA